MYGPNSGILVILDEEAEPTFCFELCKSHQLDSSPFPQNKKIELQYGNDAGRYVAFIPVLGQPLSSNRYYALKAQGRHKGQTFRNSLEGDVVTCCFRRCFPDIEPQLADHHDIYQQFEICPKKRGGFFVAKLMAPDGVPSKFLRRNAPRSSTLDEALVLDNIYESVIVGKWYCPFIFIKDGRPKDQYNVVMVDMMVEREVIRLNGKTEAISETLNRVMWFREGIMSVWLNLDIVERMKWEEERFRWSGGKERVEKKKTNGEWNRFGWYVL
ncbi:hypothetical protein GOBAR_DD00366 [Gossypium barbadense]|nr:hypothetical protein GOBAR_DD00366 [Gossypium barbadense]